MTQCADSGEGAYAESRVDMRLRLSPGSRLLVVRKVVWSTVPEVRCRDHLEPDGSDGWQAFKQCPRDAMHTVHHAAVRADDDRVREVHVLDQPHVLDHVTDGC